MGVEDETEGENHRCGGKNHFLVMEGEIRGGEKYERLKEEEK